ncbi:hypothetical protein B0H19DRAFT_1068958 [Mycena capillaripes]|nr:hypothetical protein B0H19DRAFT_1068958 [Mycena capillaripes]
MSVTSRGTPPRMTPLDTATLRDVQARVGELTTRPQLIEANDKVRFGNKGIVDAATAQAYMEGSNWVAKGAPFTRTELFSVLLKISLLPQTTLKSMSHMLRALAFLGEEIGDTLSNKMAVSVGQALSPLADGMVEGHNAFREEVQGLKGESAIATKTAEEMKEGLRALEAQMRDLKKSVETASTAAAAAAAEAKTAATTAPARPSYAAATAAPAITAEQAGILARGL